MTDQELISKVVTQDRDAIRQLVDRFQRDVIKTAYHLLGNMEDAEDLSQEIFIEIIRALPTFRQQSSLATWIYRITVNRALNQLKKNKRKEWFMQFPFRKLRPEELPALHNGINTTEAEIERNEMNKILYQALSRLPKNQNTAFVLSKFEDKSYAEIAEIMQVSLSAVESLIHRARLNLQQTVKNSYL